MKKLLKIVREEKYGIEERYWLREDGKITVQRVQDIEPYLNQNRVELNSRSAKASKLGRDGLGTKVASIPFGLIEQLCQQRGVNLLTCSNDQLKRILNDPEFSKLRTAHGRI
jgi:hypothetical protein